MSEAAPTLDSPAVHPTYLKLLCMLLRSHGGDVDAALVAAGLGSWKELANRETMVSYRAANQLIAHCTQTTGRSSMGFEVGAMMQISTHGPLGYAMISSKDLRQALQTAARYVPLRIRLMRFQLHEQTEGATFELIERLDLGESREFVNSALFAMFLRLMEAVVGQPLDGLKVSLPFAAPAWRRELGQAFNGEIRFEAQRLAFHIPHDLLDHPCMTADAPAFERACLECELLHSQAATSRSTAQRVRELMQGREGQYPSLGAAARFFNLSPSTLIRRLKDDGTSFQELLDATRQERAQWYLAHTQLTVEEIAARLGYRDTTNFSRTFRRWRGTTPSEVRKLSLLAQVETKGTR